MVSRLNVHQLLRHVILASASLIYLFPFLWMFLTSFKTQTDIFSAELSILPTVWTLENYREALTRVPMLRYLGNGLIVCLGIFAMQVIFCVPCAYALAKGRFRGRDGLFKAIVLALMIPYAITAIPLYIAFYKIGLLNSYAALIIPFVSSAFGIFLLRQHFVGVPDDLINAARLDGIGEYRIVWKIMLPTAIPAISAFFIFSFVTHWNDYMWPLLVITDPALATPPLGIIFFRTEEVGSVQFGPLMAAAVLITSPLIAVFLFAQRKFIEGMTLAGMKG
ncbi:carbohydrate ABC transporter permease [Methylibium sp. Root1272]|uniref:carbohydrate ABC transporter permease n=1 Tax=Methylibium sp. Root1272 TaxID=1736441 RepID=UPI0006FCBC52|nr:carbohydrate ABC transporter permease [Methylibium sp. Root1272]KQW70071.1 sugar ABC transporter permease [Methylibium sp. Root1272]